MSKSSNEESFSEKGSEEKVLAGQSNFESLLINVKNLHTVISLLKCAETDIVISTLTALSKFVGKSTKNIKILLDYAVLDNLMDLMENEDPMIRRSSTKLFGEMTVAEVARTVVLGNEVNWIGQIMDVLHEEHDFVVQKHILHILTNFAEDVFVTYRILESSRLTCLLRGLQSTEVDVRKASGEVILKLMENPWAIDRISELQEFNLDWFSGTSYGDQDFSEVVLPLIKHLLLRPNDEKIHKMFRDSGGVEKLLEILRGNLWEELHPILEVLVLATVNQKTAENFSFFINTEYISELLSSVGNSDPLVLQLLSNLSTISEFRKILQKLGIVQVISTNLDPEIDPEIVNPVSTIVGNICHLPSAMRELMEADMTSRLIGILRNEEINWASKTDVIFAITEMVRQNPRNGESLMNFEGLSLITLTLQDAVPMDMRLGCLDILNSVMIFPKIRSFFIRPFIVEALSNLFAETNNAELHILSLSILSRLFVEEKAMNLCFDSNFLEKLCPLICTEQPIPVQSAAIELIQQLCYDETIIDEFVRLGYLNILQDNRKIMRTVIPSWDTCLDAMFSGHLPLKFANTGRLALRDVIKDGFYVVRRHCHTFPSLNELLASRCSPMECMYTINFAEEGAIPTGSAHSSIHWIDDFEEADSDRLCFSPLSSIFCGKFGRLRPDPRLRQDLQDFLRILDTSQSIDTSSQEFLNVINVSKIEFRAVLLAKFVAHRFSSAAEFPGDVSIDEKLKDHLQELRENLETSIIPLGELRFGSYLERALLFKAIADKIGLPVALVRGEYGKTWVEIAIPQVHKIESRNQLPTKLLRPNFIVDLMDEPGDLIPVSSNKARKFYEYRL